MFVCYIQQLEKITLRLVNMYLIRNNIILNIFKATAANLHVMFYVFWKTMQCEYG